MITHQQLKTLIRELHFQPLSSHLSNNINSCICITEGFSDSPRWEIPRMGNSLSLSSETRQHPIQVLWKIRQHLPRRTENPVRAALGG